MVFRWIVGGTISYVFLRSIYRHYWRPINISKMLKSEKPLKSLNGLTVAITRELKQKSYSFQESAEQTPTIKSDAIFVYKQNKAIFFTQRLLLRKEQRYLETLLQNPIEEQLRHAITLNKKHLHQARPYSLSLALREFEQGSKITFTIQQHTQPDTPRIKWEQLTDTNRNFIIFTNTPQFIIVSQDKQRPIYPFYNKTIGYRFIGGGQIEKMLRDREVSEIWEVWNNSPYINSIREVEMGGDCLKLETSRAQVQRKRIKLIVAEGHEYYPMVIVDV